MLSANLSNWRLGGSNVAIIHSLLNYAFFCKPHNIFLFEQKTKLALCLVGFFFFSIVVFSESGRDENQHLLSIVCVLRAGQCSSEEMAKCKDSLSI